MVRNHAESASPRILLFSQRSWNNVFYMPLTYEFEETIRRIDTAQLLAPPFRWDSRLGRMWFRGGNFAKSSLGMLVDPGIDMIEIDQDYDLFFCLLSFASEIPTFKKLRDLKKRCRKAVCMFVELWSSHVDRFHRSLEILNELEFDHVFVHHRSCLPALQQVLKCPCSFLPLGVDCDRFTPFPIQPARCIDCYSIGRRSPDTHQSLLGMSRAGDFFYLYDTAVRPSLTDWREHRDLVAGNIKRSRYFMCYKPALRDDEVIGSDESLAARFFEGAAGGAVMLGVPPNCSDYRDLFDWPDATVCLPLPCHDIRRFINELDNQPERTARIRKDNIVQSLLRHDWSYRWSEILRSVSLEPSQEHIKRERRLKATATHLESSLMYQEPAAVNHR